MKIRKNDEVQVIAGKKDKDGKFQRGKVHRVLVAEDRVVVSGVHMIKRHTKPRRVRTQAGIIEREAPIHVSNVMLVCPKCNRATRVGFRFLADGAKVRVCKRCGEMIDKQ